VATHATISLQPSTAIGNAPGALLFYLFISTSLREGERRGRETDRRLVAVTKPLLAVNHGTSAERGRGEKMRNKRERQEVYLSLITTPSLSKVGR
jgi:hypothetical protein